MFRKACLVALGLALAAFVPAEASGACVDVGIEWTAPREMESII